MGTQAARPQSKLAVLAAASAILLTCCQLFTTRCMLLQAGSSHPERQAWSNMPGVLSGCAAQLPAPLLTGQLCVERQMEEQGAGARAYYRRWTEPDQAQPSLIEAPLPCGPWTQQSSQAAPAVCLPARQGQAASQVPVCGQQSALTCDPAAMASLLLSVKRWAARPLGGCPAGAISRRRPRICAVRLISTARACEELQGKPHLGYHALACCMQHRHILRPRFRQRLRWHTSTPALARAEVLRGHGE